MPAERLKHILNPQPPETNAFTTSRTGRGKNNIPSRDRPNHAKFLKKRLAEEWEKAESELLVHHTTRKGIYLEFKGKEGYDLITKSLEDRHSKNPYEWTRLLNIRKEEKIVTDSKTGEEEKTETVYATVFVPHTKKDSFLKKLEDYANKSTKSGKPKNQLLIESIDNIKKAAQVESFWTYENEEIPESQPEWCEIWFSNETGKDIKVFEKILSNLNIKFKSGCITFPERTVKVAFANRSQLEELTHISDDIAEYRRAKGLATFWIRPQRSEQLSRVNELLDRVEFDRSTNTSICILDTGVNNGHPLLNPILIDKDCHTIDESWGTNDHGNHGTQMAGLAAYGDLIEQLSHSSIVKISHRLESSKINSPRNDDSYDSYGYLTIEGISRAEIQAPGRKRINCLSLTVQDRVDKGRPSSWSGALDQITSGSQDATRRLLIVAAGNIHDLDEAKNYPHAQMTHSIQDPAQSWNSLTVGAYTEMVLIEDTTFSDFIPVAPSGGLSPFSSTSLTWDKKWPIKPEVIMEGGNLACDSEGKADTPEDLCLLSTHSHTDISYFTSCNATSAATALASWFAAQIQSRYPEYWPETIRALIVHSADWSDRLKEEFLDDSRKKGSYHKLMRVCGYGIPDLDKALYSASNSLTLISQEEIKPFYKPNKKDVKTKDMHLYDLPWPIEVLRELPDIEVKMKVTLSYFIEPSPGEKGWKDRYRYPSHGLRFDLKSPRETADEFTKRINKAALGENENKPNTNSASSHWVIGSDLRDRGSIHSDIWHGSPAELADSNVIAVYPTIGWWKTRKHLNGWKKSSRYSLIVSIYTPEEDIDIYTPVAQKIGIAVPIKIS